MLETCKVFTLDFTFKAEFKVPALTQFKALFSS